MDLGTRYPALSTRESRGSASALTLTAEPFHLPNQGKFRSGKAEGASENMLVKAQAGQSGESSAWGSHLLSSIG